jgi:hypothetical protein
MFHKSSIYFGIAVAFSWGAAQVMAIEAVKELKLNHYSGR